MKKVLLTLTMALFVAGTSFATTTSFENGEPKNKKACCQKDENKSCENKENQAEALEMKACCKAKMEEAKKVEEAPKKACCSAKK